jgi:hypothetical protein
MINLCINEAKALSLEISDQVRQQGMDKECAVVRVLNKIFENKAISEGSPSLECLAKTPYAYGILSFMHGHLNESKGAELQRQLQKKPAEILERIHQKKFSVIQNSILLPTQETRGEQIIIDVNWNGYTNVSFDEHLNYFGSILGSDWIDFISIIRFITIIKISSWPELPYFSGSTSDLWGAMHMCAPRYEEVIAECITHEAAHFWLNLADEVNPISLDSWGRAEWLSPWRHDKRPIGGVIHGVFVFSCVALVLALLFAKSKNADTQLRLRRRIEKVTSQVHEGAQECLRSGLLTEVGESIVCASTQRADFSVNFILKTEK